MAPSLHATVPSSAYVYDLMVATAATAAVVIVHPQDAR